MASRVRVLLLSLLAFGQHATALRSQGYSGIKPHFQLAEDFPRSHKPALASSSSERSALPGGSLGSYGHSYTDSGSSESLKPFAAPSAGGYGGSYGRQVNSYSPEGSVSSYRPGLLMAQKPRQTPQQPHYQMNPNKNGVFQTKAGMWDVASPQNGDSFESRIVSSYGNEMHSGNPAQPQQPPRYPSQPQQPPSYSKPRPQQPPSYPSKPWPQQPPSYSKPQQPPSYSKPQQPPSYSKPQQPPSYSKPRPQQPPSYLSKPRPQQPPSYLSKPRPQQPPSYPSKAQQPRYPAPSYPSKPRPQQPPSYSKPQQPPSYPSKAQQPPSYPSKAQQPRYPAQPRSYTSRPQQPPSYTSRPQQPPSYTSRPQQPPSYTSRPQQPPRYPSKPHQPSDVVTQSKAGMWDLALSQEGLSLSQEGVDSGDDFYLNPQMNIKLRSSRPVPRAPVYQSPWQQQVPVYSRLRQPWEGS